VQLAAVVDPGNPARRQRDVGRAPRGRCAGYRGTVLRPRGNKPGGDPGGQQQACGPCGQPPAAAPSAGLREERLGFGEAAGSLAGWGDHRASLGTCPVLVMELL
jgi:hypothetical protein